MVASNAVDGRDEEFNEWYDNVHVHDICSIDGVLGATRYEIESDDSSVPHRYLAVYELDRDQAGVFADIVDAVISGAFFMSDSLDSETSTSTVWRVH
jgi:hypothetical protein